MSILFTSIIATLRRSVQQDQCSSCTSPLPTALLLSHIYVLFADAAQCIGPVRHKTLCKENNNFKEKQMYTECNRRNGPDFERVFLRSYYTDITQNTYIQSSMVTEILAREV